jgi:signal transduction histidine kinase
MHRRSSKTIQDRSPLGSEGERAGQKEPAAFRKLNHTEERLRDLETLCQYSSHNLRSPLGAILNLAVVLKEDYQTRLDRQGMEHLERMVRSARRSVAILDSLIVFAGMSRDSVSKSSFDARSLIEDAYEETLGTHGDMLARASGRAPDFVVDVAATAFADPRMIRIVFAQLFSNSLRSTRDRAQSRIEVRGTSTPQETLFSIEDNGVGLEPAMKERLFKGVPFGDWKPGGSGLGLEIVDRIIRYHGGRVWAEDEVAQGAKIAFVLPNS